MNLDTIERLIDEAIEKEDYEKLLKLLDERERLLKSMELSEELIQEILKKDQVRMEIVMKKKADLVETIMKSRKYGKSLKAYGESINEQGKRNWGRG